MSVEISRPFMGRHEFQADDPDLDSKIEALREKAKEFGSNVVPLAYRGEPVVRVYYGTNHNHQYAAEDHASATGV